MTMSSSEDCRDVIEAYYSRRPPGHGTICAEPLSPTSKLGFSFAQNAREGHVQNSTNKQIYLRDYRNRPPFKPAQTPLYPASMHQKGQSY
ncbi:hypothetical protein N7499_006623 [Penicillium canescens]|uniref:Uncharacterized protein n=1 Tax=Penicillium canescens TaxID=5083 RepID=A0AAD6IDU8_PENCN|nr:uncharacterized protein N7446_002315 [Penicillium canescens]KAJ5997061.1 hypothetical protein N7522_008721 [Penicillium canescens]KAJ6044119.1 hypothetical protein N7460_005474 [Penicillium canescens]KAJ6055590.1 hypothetical protein N7444_004688 [Penicillium canescens]KAJ6074538.1 hypothetical protein N7446_002315 [Penicillium canescens]KAJ6081749.1 hypothetical protein N7499_006623 [Penicillium canescens]